MPTLPLSGGKLNTVMASFLSTFFFFASLAQLMARPESEAMRSGSEWLLPVAESRPAKMMGSRPPSSSGSATWRKEAAKGAEIWRPQHCKLSLTPDDSAPHHIFRSPAMFRSVSVRFQWMFNWAQASMRSGYQGLKVGLHTLPTTSLAGDVKWSDQHLSFYAF